MRRAAVQHLSVLIAVLSVSCVSSPKPRDPEGVPPPPTPPATPASAPDRQAGTPPAPGPVQPETPARSAAPHPTSIPANVLEAATRRAEGVLRGRYMEKNCQPTHYPNWQGFPLQRCSYEAGGRHAEVILLDADAPRLARWVINACVEAEGSASDDCLQRTFQDIRDASGAQFAVAGVVLEDLSSRATGFENYCFREGVTVKVAAWPSGAARQLTPGELEACMNGPLTDTASTSGYARIISTSRDDWRISHVDADVEGLAWLEVVRRAYQESWGSDRNPLIVAKLVAARKPLRGWPAAYDAHVKQEAAKATALLDLAASRMSELCPRWADMSRAERLTFYGDLLYAIAGQESARVRTVMYNETGILGSNGGQAVDPLTGRPVQSEGLLQLSYQDMRHYPAADGLSCTFDWNQDKAAFEADLAGSGGNQSFQSTHPARSILDPYVQLTCGLHVLNTLAKARPTESFPSFAGRYWSTMRPTGKAYPRIIAELKQRKSACFASP